MEEISLDKIQRLSKMSPQDRRTATRVNFAYFFVYYLGHYVNYEFSPFHYEMLDDVHDLIDGTIKELAWIQFRESAKTSIAKGLLLYLICFRIDEYINVDSYDKENAERILFDVVYELQNNARIIQDFGQLYTVHRTKDQSTQKRISNFITNHARGQTGIRVEAHSTQEPVRGRLHGAKRPGLVILDDFETKKTIKSEEYTKNIREHIQEFKGGLDSTRGRVLYLANYLSEFANVQSIIERGKIDPKVRVRIVPILDDYGKPTWPSKYAATDQEAQERGLVSIEEIRRKMWTPEVGDDDFMSEMLCRPIDYANSEFKKEWFEQNRYKSIDLDSKQLSTFICFDNAPSTNEHSDWIGCTVVSVDNTDTWYVRFVKRYRLNTPDLIEELFRLYEVWQPQTIGFEQKAFQDLIEPYIKKRAEELQQYPYVVELKDKGQRKEDRIRGRLQGRFKNGKIKLLAYATDDTPELVKELAQFPNAKHDDLSDSLQYHAEIVFAPEKPAPEKPVTMQDWIQHDIKSIYERGQNPDHGQESI